MPSKTVERPDAAKGITKHDAGRVQNWRLRQWHRTHLLQALRDKPNWQASSFGW